MRAPTLALPLVVMSLTLVGCPAEDPPPVASETETDTGEPSCLDTDTPGADIVINSDDDIAELQLSECVPEAIIISGLVTNLSGLSNLREVGRLEIRFCPMLQNMFGLQDLVRVDHLEITGNSAMTTLPDFQDLATVNNLLIKDNPGLLQLGSFPALTSVARLDVSSNEDLVDFTGLDSIGYATSNVTLSSNGVTVDMTGLGAMTSVGGNLLIEDNPELNDLVGLGVTNVGGDVNIISNAKLSECIAQAFLEMTDITGAAIEADNDQDFCG